MKILESLQYHILTRLTVTQIHRHRDFQNVLICKPGWINEVKEDEIRTNFRSENLLQCSINLYWFCGGQRRQHRGVHVNISQHLASDLAGLPLSIMPF